MILQYKAPKIVMLTRIEERNSHNQLQMKCHPYFPTNKDEILRFGETMIKVTDIEYYHDADLEIRHLFVQNVKIFFELIIKWTCFLFKELYGTLCYSLLLYRLAGF